MILKVYTIVHTLISLAGIGSGLVVVFGMLTGLQLDGWTTLFLASTALSCITGFFFPFHGFKPSYGVGVLTLIAVALAYQAGYKHHFSGGWRTPYVISTVLAVYFNVFVLIVQSFLKVPTLNTLAPTQTETPFKITQLITLAVFVGLAVCALK